MHLHILSSYKSLGSKTRRGVERLSKVSNSGNNIQGTDIFQFNRDFLKSESVDMEFDILKASLRNKSYV